MEKVYKTNNALETIALGEKIGKLLNSGDVILLTGDLSAGKTTLTKGIGKALGVKGVINSPTFTIVKEYNGSLPLYHLDLYRLEGLNTDFDLEEYVFGDGVCVIEWPFQIEEILPENYLEIKLERLSLEERRITIKDKGVRYKEVLEGLEWKP